MSKKISSIGLMVKLIIILATVGCATIELAKQRPPEKVPESSTQFQPVIKPKITDKKIDVSLSINLKPTLYRPDPYDPIKNEYNILAIYKKNEHIRITTDLSASGAQSLKGKDGFTVVTYPVTVNYSPSTPVKPKILSHTAVFSPVVEKLAGVSLAGSELCIPDSHSNKFITEVRDKGIPLGEDSYGFNFYGVKAEMKFTLDNSGEIISAELEYLDINSSHFNASYTSSEGKKLNPRIISLKDFMNKTAQPLETNTREPGEFIALLVGLWAQVDGDPLFVTNRPIEGLEFFENGEATILVGQIKYARAKYVIISPDRLKMEFPLGGTKLGRSAEFGLAISEETLTLTHRSSKAVFKKTQWTK